MSKYINLISSCITIAGFIYTVIKFMLKKLRKSSVNLSNCNPHPNTTADYYENSNFIPAKLSLWDRFWISFLDTIVSSLTDNSGIAIIVSILIGSLATTSYQDILILALAIVFSCYLVSFTIACTIGERNISSIVVIRYLTTAVFAVATVYSLHFVQAPTGTVIQNLTYYAFSGLGITVSLLAVTLATGSSIHLLKNTRSIFNKDWGYLIMSIMGFLLTSGVAHSLWLKYFN